MANVLMVNLPYAGHTNPTLPLAAELVRRGHAVTYINAPEWRGKMEETGVNFIPYSNYPANPGEQQKKTRCFRAAFDTALSLHGKFDLLIYEMFFYPGIRIAEKLGIPCVRQFSQPAWGEESTADATAFFRLSCKLIDVQIMGRGNARYMGLKNKTLIEAVLHDKPNLNLVYVPREFQAHAASFGSDYLFAVPPFRPAPSKLVIPYEKMEHPILYISLGSIISNRGFCKECIRAFGGKKISVILNTGKVNPQSLGKIPDNIHCYSFVPQVEVLSRASVFLTHCGMNSVNEAIAMGVPMIAMPFLNDQFTNAKRIAELGIGERVRSFPSRARELYSTAVCVLHDTEMKRRCTELQRAVTGGGNFADTVDRVEALLPGYGK